MFDSVIVVGINKFLVPNNNNGPSLVLVFFFFLRFVVSLGGKVF